ncbi:hypothetical protein ZWY2020_042819 [Hordeum vulgare]|nr:hypothetical protein ZWY2020_042819 [Hordeum vulgare]
MEVEVKLRLPDAAAHRHLSAYLAPRLQTDANKNAFFDASARPLPPPPSSRPPLTPTTAPPTPPRAQAQHDRQRRQGRGGRGADPRSRGADAATRSCTTVRLRTSSDTAAAIEHLQWNPMLLDPDEISCSRSTLHRSAPPLLACSSSHRRKANRKLHEVTYNKTLDLCDHKLTKEVFLSKVSGPELMETRSVAASAFNCK